MSLTRVRALYVRQFYLIRDNPVRLVQIFAWVFFDIVLWGFLTKYLGNLVGERIQFTPLFLGAILIWNFVTRTMHGIATGFFEDVWSRNFLNVFGSPVSVGEYIMALVLVGITTAVGGLLWMMLVAWIFFGFSVFAYGWLLVPFLLILFLTGIALGIGSVALVLRLGPSAEWLIWPIPEVLSPFVGVFYPVATLPLWLQFVARLLPPSYVFDGVRSLVFGYPFAPHALLLAIVLALAYIALAYLAFRGVYRLAIRRGLIARYSAETAT